MKNKVEKVELKGIRKSFKGGTVALNDINISFYADRGIIGILGPNGAGKTTLLRIVSTVLQPSGGEILINNKNLYEFGINKYRRRIGYLPQEFGVYRDLTPVQFLKRIGYLYGLKGNALENRVKFIIQMIDITDFMHKPLSECSSGMIQRVGIAQSMLSDPDFLILDEPLVGLDPVERIGIMNILTRLSREKIINFSTHIVSAIESLCHSVIILKNGEVLADGVVDDLIHTIDGKVFETFVPDTEISAISEGYKVVKFRNEGKDVRLRILSENKTAIKGLKSLKKVKPTLEDFYVWKLRSI